MYELVAKYNKESSGKKKKKVLKKKGQAAAIQARDCAAVIVTAFVASFACSFNDMSSPRLSLSLSSVQSHHYSTCRCL